MELLLALMLFTSPIVAKADDVTIIEVVGKPRHEKINKYIKSVSDDGFKDDIKELNQLMEKYDKVIQDVGGKSKEIERLKGEIKDKTTEKTNLSKKQSELSKSIQDLKSKIEGKKAEIEKRKAEELARQQEEQRKAEEQKRAEEQRKKQVTTPNIPSTGSAVEAFNSLVASYGLNSVESNSWAELIRRESGWNITATNPSSGAYGLPQSLPGHKMATHGSDWQTNPVTQLRWMYDYVMKRYGSFENALAIHNSRGWY